MKNLFVKLFFILVTAVGYASSIHLFLVPFNFNAGSAPGIVTLVQYFLPISMSLGLFLINLPLLLASLKYLGKKFSLYTIIGTLTLTFVFDFIANWQISIFHNLPLISALVGGIMNGLSLGVAFKFGYSLGGISLLAKIVERVTGHMVGTLNLIVNAIIVVISFFLNPSLLILSGSILFLSVATITVNLSVYGKDYINKWKNNFGEAKRFALAIQLNLFK